MDIRKFFSTTPKASSTKKDIEKREDKTKPKNEDSSFNGKENTKAEPTISPEANNNKKNSAKERKKEKDEIKVTEKKSKARNRSGTNSSKEETTPKSKSLSDAPNTQQKSTKNQTSESTKTSWKDKLYDDDIVSIDDDDDDFTTSKRKDDKRKRKKKIESDEDIEVMDVSEEDSPIHKTKGSKRKGKKGAKAKKGTVIYDSDSEKEDESKPKKVRATSRPRKRKTHGCLEESDEEHQVSIVDAFKHTKSKKLVDDVTSPLKSEMSHKQSPTKKKLISAADFFGTSSVKQSEKTTLAVKRKAEESPGKQNDKAEIDDMEIHDDEEFEKTLAALDDKQPSKKIKREDGTSEVSSPSTPKPSTVAAKLSQKAAQSQNLVAETPEREMGGRSKTTVRSSPKQEKNKTPVKSPQYEENKTPKKPSPLKTSPKETSNKTPTLEKKGSTSYRSYMQREGPRALGSKEIPEGADNCMEGLTFVITGVLDSMERDEAKTLVERYGGKVTTSLSKKTSYVVIGRDPGESKITKANQFGTKQLDEDGLLNLVKTLPGKKSKYEIHAEKEAAAEKKSANTSTSHDTTPRTPNLSRFAAGNSQSTPKANFDSPKTAESSQASQLTQSPQVNSQSLGETLLWVDKYRPKTMKQIIGQQGDKSNAKKLLNWLNNWHRNVAAGKKPAFNRFNDDGSGHRAALLSGPPGVGKTTTATVVCQEAGFTFVELNASDNRSKKSLQTEVAEALGNHTLADFFGESSHKKQTDGKKHCLVMDEVDGMAGNEDRGGVQELISLIKTSKIPIICMCNDRNHPKIRSLANYCFDLRFQRPRLEQIKSAMMSIAFKEGIKIPPPALNDVIAAANQDIRQVLNNLSMWSSKEKSLSIEQVKADANKARKDMHLGPFDVCRKVFVGGEETANMTIHDKSDLFFHDYSFGPLFVQENYIQVTPYSARGNVRKHLEQLSKAADSLADGDLVGKCVRSSNNWSLLPTQAIYASVIPGEMMRGTMGGMINFPAWLGKNSSTNKTERILSELRNHMCLKVSADKRSLNTDYLPHLRRTLTSPLRDQGSDGVRDVIDVMSQYDLLREDMDGIIEISQWPGMKDPMAGVETKVKSAFTRTFNKEAHMTPYAVTQTAKKGRGRKGGGETEEILEGEEGEEGSVQNAGSDEDNQSDDDVTNDAMIKAKKKTAAKQETKTEGKGKGKAGGKGTVKGKGKGKKS